MRVTEPVPRWSIVLSSLKPIDHFASIREPLGDFHCRGRELEVYDLVMGAITPPPFRAIWLHGSPNHALTFKLACVSPLFTISRANIARLNF